MTDRYGKVRLFPLSNDLKWLCRLDSLIDRIICWVNSFSSAGAIGSQCQRLMTENGTWGRADAWDTKSAIELQAQMFVRVHIFAASWEKVWPKSAMVPKSAILKTIVFSFEFWDFYEPSNVPASDLSSDQVIDFRPSTFSSSLRVLYAI